MSNLSSFMLRIISNDPDELTAAREYLFSTPWEWEISDVERRLAPQQGFRLRTFVQADESMGGTWISGDDGMLGEFLATFPGLRVEGRFRDGYGQGKLDGLDKYYETEFGSPHDNEDEDEEVEDGDGFDFDPEDDGSARALLHAGILVIVSDVPLAENDADFATMLQAVAELLGQHGGRELGFTLVGDETLEWTVSGELPSAEPEQVRELCRELRRLRLPLDTRVVGAPEGIVNVWPVSNRPWRSIF